MSQPDLVAEAEAIRSAVATREPSLAAAEIAGIGWATVDLDRAERELGVYGPFAGGKRDRLLGAACRIGHSTGGSGALRGEPPDPGPPWVLLLEPDTEGRLAATLARFGEGVAVIYLRPAAGGSSDASPVSGGRLEAGPLGTGRLVPGGRPWGPHAVVLEP